MAPSTEEVKAALRRALENPEPAAPELLAPAAPPPTPGVRLRPMLPVPKPAAILETSGGPAAGDPDDAAEGWTSWIGGRPRVPAGLVWPMGDEGPLRFVCQVDCTRLPTRVWRGAGPREGWLVAFAGPRSGQVAAELWHVTELGPVLAPPAPAAGPDEADDPDDAIDPEDAAASPCWPAEILDAAEGADDPFRDAMDPVLRAAEGPALPEIDLDAPPWRPGTVAALRLLIGLLREEAEAARREAVSAEPAPVAALPQARAAILQAARALRTRFERHDPSAAPDTPVGAALWAPYARVISEWRKLLLAEQLQAGEPLHGWAARVLRFAESLIRQAAQEQLDETDAYAALVAAREPCRALARAIGADARLVPPEDAPARAVDPAVYAMYAAELRSVYATLSDLKATLGVRGRVADPSGANAVFPDDGAPESWGEALARLARHEAEAARLVEEAERAAVALSEARAARAAAAAAARRLAGLIALADDLPAAGAIDWDAWRARLAPLLPEGEAWVAVRAAYADAAARAALRVYLADPAGFADPAGWLPQWRDIARFETLCLDGPPRRPAALLPPEDTQRALVLEVPSSRVFGWEWGAAEHLVLAMARDALRRSAFERVETGLTST